MIVRISKRENPFAQIDKRLLEDKRLSWRSKGILAYLLSKPNNWEVRSEDVIAHGSEGRDAVRAAMAELKSFGYAKLEQTRNGKQWVVFEEPCPENPSMGPCPEKAKIGKSATSNNKEENNNECALFDLKPEPKKKKHKAGHVNGSRPCQATIEKFCVEQGLPKMDGEIMLLKWNADGWPQNWMDKIRYWKRLGWMPSQKNGTGKRSSLPADNDVPTGWNEWLKEHPEYARKCAGLTYRTSPPWMHTEFNNERKKSTAVAKS